jgi:hypothetical protein
MVERLVLGAVMSAFLAVVERLLTSQRDLQRAQRLLQRVKGRR